MGDISTTGIKSLDSILQNLRLGDNVVLQIDDIKSYKKFTDPFVQQALADEKKIVYIRFAKHSPLVKNKKVKIYKLEADCGFESFSKQIHDIITKEGFKAFYVFDCLSDLLSSWATDLMIGNFFMVTCPYLFKLNTIAYFALLRNKHSFKTIARIRETTQLLLDIFHFAGKIYVHPLKVWNRYSPTMFLPHVEKKDKFVPLGNSAEAARLFSYVSFVSAESAKRSLDYWDHLFLEAEEVAKLSLASPKRAKMLAKLSAIMLGREERMLSLVKEKFSLEDLLKIKARMVGTGYIGGKTLGMLLARKILQKDNSFDWEKYLEPHDSFYIGSDVFYTYIVENGWWDLWLEQKTEAGFFPRAKELREKMLSGVFPDEIKEKLHQMIEYFGQSPIIVRSSSLLEDSFGNAFAGKYESIFCVNQGTPEERYFHFEQVVKKIFASCMNEDALNYRLQRGLSLLDEQMALLVQRVSGKHYKDSFFPFMAGVGVSYNTFVWHENMQPQAGMLRLVFGLGTRAVDRVEGDYPRIVALDHPLLKPYADMDKLKKFSQHDVDILNISQNILQTISLQDLLQKEQSLCLDSIGERDFPAEAKMKELGLTGEAWILTFDKFLSKTAFPKIMQRMLKVLESAYAYPVDIEFTLNFDEKQSFQINLLQCRPLQAKGSGGRVKIPKNISDVQLLFRAKGNFMGGSVSQTIQRLIFVDPAAYSNLLMSKKYEIARLIGQINRGMKQEKLFTLLIGPGRWGTRDPSLGVPVSFSEINNISALVEIDDPEGGFMPELSFGSHFFLDLVEAKVFYAALFMENKEMFFNKQWLDSLLNILKDLIPEASEYASILKVYDFPQKGLKLLSDVSFQKAFCFLPA